MVLKQISPAVSGVADGGQTNWLPEFLKKQDPQGGWGRESCFDPYRTARVHPNSKESARKFELEPENVELPAHPQYTTENLIQMDFFNEWDQLFLKRGCAVGR